MQTYTLKVADIKHETFDTITLCFKQPGLKKVKYVSGQYLTLIFRINGRRYIRPYSFSSSPKTESYLEITIKRVNNGIISNHINDFVKIGDVIEALSPMGEFVVPNHKKFNEVFLWGVGSGITPLISIAKSLLFEQENTIVNLIYGNKNIESTIFHNSILSLNEDFQTRFKPWYFYTKPITDDENSKIFNITKGRINPSTVLNNKGKKDYKDTLHFICGPAELKKSIKKSLKDYNIADEDIFVEDFELVKNPEDFKNIETRSIQLNFNGEERTLEIAKGKSILEVALDSDIELPYSCQTGNCSTCKGKLINGKIKMIGLTKERKDLAVNEYLLCCSHPLSDNVYLEV